MKKLIILDRDGVINHDSDEFIKSPREWVAIDGSLEAIAKLNHAGYQVVIASNQSGIARRLISVDDLVQIHNKMHRLANEVGGHIAGIFFCPHGPRDDCDCRKPKPGLLVDIANRFNTSLDDVPVIGDSIRDIKAAVTAGAQPFLVRTGKGIKAEHKLADEGLAHVPCFDDLDTVTEHLLATS